MMTAPVPLGSVIIPAHNEALVISRCLDALLDGFEPGELDVLVVCNGCTDKTADIARSTGHAVRVLEIETASKTAALRAGEESATSFPRLYLDADVVLTEVAARGVLGYLQSTDSLVARPPIKYDTKRSSLLVRSYYRARVKVPGVMSAVWGAGCYGLSAAGRARFADYPDVIADDLFVDQHFSRAEIMIVDAPPVIVTVPRRTADLLRILRRTYRGNTENRAISTGQVDRSSTTSSTSRELRRLALTGPVQALDVFTYAALAMLARITLSVAASRGWERDNGSRTD
jgi:glycosyltransferase involved in cell wall biosynthesis